MHILPLVQIKKKDFDLVGNKALSLAELAETKYPVPEAYVVTDEAWREFLKQNELLVPIRTELGRLDVQDLHSVDYASRKLSEFVLEGTIPEKIQTQILQQFSHTNSQYMAVRSSVVAHPGSTLWAGELPSFLHVPATDVLETVKQCWAGLFSTRTLYHLAQRSLSPEEIHLGVIVQRMVNAEMSGRFYTYHPVTQDDEQIVIEATYGFGEMPGEQAPPFDTYVVQKEPYEFLEQHIVEQNVEYVTDHVAGLVIQEIPADKRDKSVLSEFQVKELAEIAIRIGQAFAHPVEVEWIFDGQFWLIQATDRTNSVL